MSTTIETTTTTATTTATLPAEVYSQFLGRDIDGSTAILLTIGQSYRGTYAPSAYVTQHDGDAWVTEDYQEKWQEYNGEWYKRQDFVHSVCGRQFPLTDPNWENDFVEENGEYRPVSYVKAIVTNSGGKGWRAPEKAHLLPGDEFPTCKGLLIKFNGQWHRRSEMDRIQGYHYGHVCEAKGEPGNAEAKFRIGFEIEKNYVGEQRERVPRQPFFAGWEHDSSCGVEGISHHYPLVTGEPDAQFLADVEASPLLNEGADLQCGGHITVSYTDYREVLNLAKVREYAGLIYALYYKRLNQSYCSTDKALDHASGDHYCVIRRRGKNRFEFRLFSAVKNQDQVIWRYKILAQMMEAIEQNRSFGGFVKKCMPLLRENYSGAALKRLTKRAKHFDAYLNEGIIDSSIREYLR